MSNRPLRLQRFRTGLCSLSWDQVQKDRRAWGSLDGAGFSIEFCPLEREISFLESDPRKVSVRETNALRPPEIQILASSKSRADFAAMLLYAAHAVIDGCVPWGNLRGWDPYRALLCDHDLEKASSDLGALSTDIIRFQGGAIPDIAGMAVRLSRRKVLTEAAFNFLASLYLYSFDFWDLHPQYGIGLIPRESNPMHRVWEAQSLFGAFQVIETLDVTVKGAKANKPSIQGGVWDPGIRSDLEARLMKIGISPSETMLWVSRGTLTKNQRKLRDRTSDSHPMTWNHGTVRDERIPFVDAINRAQWLRSNVTAHRSAGRLEGHHPVDTFNVQMLARMLILNAVKAPFLKA